MVTAAADKPLQLMRRFKIERLPNVAVTVDLLTTSIDVPEAANLDFLRRVPSRILYQQMLGRATLLFPDLNGSQEDKECFRIYDAVDLYSALEPYAVYEASGGVRGSPPHGDRVGTLVSREILNVSGSFAACSR